MKSLNLTERLGVIAQNIKGNSLADIGCDHGKLIVYALKTNMVERAIAVDISAKSLLKAKKLAQKHNIADKISFRESNGLDMVDSQEVSDVVISGLGGHLISEIVERAYRRSKQFENYIFSPHSHAEVLRETVLDCKLKFVLETMVCDNKMFYPVMVLSSTCGEEHLTEDELKYGFKFYTRQSFFAWLKTQIKRYQSIYKKTMSSKVSEKELELQKIYQKYKSFDCFDDKG